MLEFVRIQKAFPLYVRRAALPGTGARLRAVHLSDLHLEDGFSEGWLRRLVARVNAAEPDIAEKLAVLETVFEDGRYWNHAGAADWLDPVLCVTDTPCAHSTAGESTCNTYRGALLAEFPDFSGIQCFGYASLLSDLLFGVDAPVTAHTDFSRVRVGDMIRLPESMHSMLVTAVDREAETVTVTEVNADYETCRIAWGRTVTREALYANGDSVTFYTRYAD